MTVYSRSLIEQSRRRVLIFKNGHGSEGVEIVANPEKFEDVSCILKTVLRTYRQGIIVRCTVCIILKCVVILVPCCVYC